MSISTNGQELGYRKTVLPNGLRVITEAMPHVRSMAIGVWVRAGTRYEPPDKNGIAHFLEHMVFKGTPSRNAFQIAQSIESLGGYLNAFTGRELNCYFIRALDEHVSIAIDVLADILQHSIFDPAELEKEKGIVIDEIKGVEDNPEELIQEVFSTLVWSPHPLSRSILGDEATVSSFTRDDLQTYLTTRYTADQIFVIAAGSVDHDQIVEEVARAFHFPASTQSVQPVTLPTPAARRQIIRRDIMQAHLCVGGYGIAFHDPRKFPLFVLNTALGGGMTSRLFQKIREEAGLVYSIYSDLDFCEDTGLWGVSAGTDPSDAAQVLDMIYAECAQLRREPLSAEELKDSKSQLIGSLVLSIESTSSVMNRLARLEIYLDEYSSIDETIASIDAVTLDEVQALAHDLFAPDRLAVAAIGPIDDQALPHPA